MSILPISSGYELDNLYPITDRVKEWNTFIVGNDKTYILSNIGDERVQVSGDDLVDTKGNTLPSELFQFFDNVWTHTLQGKQLQFYIVLNGKLYFINTYSLRNENNKIIGAILFMRNFDTIPDTYNVGKNVMETTNSILSLSL